MHDVRNSATRDLSVKEFAALIGEPLTYAYGVMRWLVKCKRARLSTSYSTNGRTLQTYEVDIEFVKQELNR